MSALFLQGDKNLLAENLRDIETRMESEDRVRVLTGVTPDSVRCAKQKQPPAPTKQEPPSQVAPYPPSAKPTLKQIVEFCKDSADCPGCFNRARGGETCHEHGCYPLLHAGFVCQYNPTEATKLLKEAKARNKAKYQQNDKGRKATETEKDDSPPNNEAPTDKAKRATSVEPPPPPLTYSEAAKTGTPSTNE